jgi:hypothetical protein
MVQVKGLLAPLRVGYPEDLQAMEEVAAGFGVKGAR